MQQEIIMKIDRALYENVMVLKLSGKVLGGTDYSLFLDEVEKLIDEGHRDIILDLGRVSRINSTGLGILVSGSHSFKNCGGEMKVCNISHNIDAILNVTQLCRVFDTYETRDEALGSCMVVCCP
jgi:anti-anti-sigma factor